MCCTDLDLMCSRCQCTVQALSWLMSKVITWVRKSLAFTLMKTGAFSRNIGKLFSSWENIFVLQLAPKETTLHHSLQGYSWFHSLQGSSMYIYVLHFSQLVSFLKTVTCSHFAPTFYKESFWGFFSCLHCYGFVSYSTIIYNMYCSKLMHL